MAIVWVVLQGIRGPGVCVGVGWGWQDGLDTGRTQPLSLALRLSGGARGPRETNTGLVCLIRGAGRGPYLPGCQRAGPKPGSLVRSDMALLAMGTGGRMEARRAASILDPEGQGVCEMEAWITNTKTPRRRRRCG